MGREESGGDPVNPVIDRAFCAIVISHPFWATLLLNLQRVEEKGGTMWTDGKRLGINPKFALEIGEKKTIGVLAHEAAHVFLKHPLRRGHRDPQLWNIACDHVVNAMILDASFELPADCIPPIRGKTAEEVYDDLVKAGKQPKQQPQQPPQPQPRQPDGGKGEGQKPDDKPGDKPGKQPGKPGDKSDGKGGKGDKPSPGDASGSGDKPSDQPGDKPGSGSGKSDDQSGQKSNEPATGQGWGEVRDQKNDDGSGMSDDDRDRAEQDTNVLIKQAVTAAKRAGKMPAGADLLADQLTEPKVDWRAILQRFIGERARSDYSWQRPNARYFSRGIVLPSLDSYGVGKVVLAGDTSGSMLHMMQSLMSEVISALELYEEQGTQQIPVIWCDTQATEQIISDPSELKPVGGGGTNFAPVFDAVRKRHADAKGVVYITDGECRSFGVDPGVPVLWALTGRNSRFKPPFGEVMVMES